MNLLVFKLIYIFFIFQYLLDQKLVMLFFLFAFYWMFLLILKISRVISPINIGMFDK
jgi:hypothetical protein